MARPPLPSARRGRTIVAGCCVLVLAACGRSATPPAAPPESGRTPGVILISIDTLRADHLGAYGYPAPTSPNIDRLAREGVTFLRASAHAPSTLLSHAAILTSQVPQHHGASHIRFRPLAADAVTLTESLKAAGYGTASFNGGGQLMAAFGLDQGFDVYQSGPDPFVWGVEKALGWLDGRAAEAAPFFLFLHTYQTHHPYTAGFEDLDLFRGDYRGPLPHLIEVELLVRINQKKLQVDQADLDFIVAAYDAEIHAMDRALGRLIAGLEARGLYQDSLIVLTSDHGEEFGEHGMVGWHSHSLYEELLRVPLVLRLPGGRLAGERPAQLARSIDIAPTVLDALGLPIPSEFAGRSWMPRLEGGADLPELPSVAGWDTPQGTYHQGLTTRRIKLAMGQVFDLERDPGERRDLGRERADLRAELEKGLRAELAARVARQGGPAFTPNDEERQRLAALGYVD